MTPNETIVAFIKRQPEQIRDSLCAGFVMTLATPDFSSSEAFVQAAVDVIDPPGTFAKVMAVVAAIGLLDYHFWRPPIAPEAIDAIAEERQSPLLKGIARRMEFTNAASERAAKEWRALRRSSLSFEAVREFEATLRP